MIAFQYHDLLREILLEVDRLCAELRLMNSQVAEAAEANHDQLAENERLLSTIRRALSLGNSECRALIEDALRR